MNNLIRKTAIAATVLLFVAISSVAQSYQDVVYLKNGSVIRGLIMEQVPSQSLKLVTPDGSTFFCTFDEVEKISKEMPAVKEKNAKLDQYGWISAPRYRGFVGEGAVIYPNENVDLSSVQFYTSHGCQIIPSLYIGAGFAVNYPIEDYVNIPFFVHIRSEFHKVLDKRTSPYIDARIGYSIGEMEGFYFNPSIGCHTYFGKTKLGLSAGLGYDLLCDYYYESQHGISLFVAFDF